MTKSDDMFPNYKHIPKTGVIYVMEKATEMGFSYGNEEWSNLGQGAPETGEINNNKRHITHIEIDPVTSEYAPVAGTKELRQAVADLYNRRYRKGKKSQYSYENVAISAGGRVALSRLAASLGNIHLGHFLPDYTAAKQARLSVYTHSACTINLQNFGLKLAFYSSFGLQEVMENLGSNGIPKKFWEILGFD